MMTAFYGSAACWILLGLCLLSCTNQLQELPPWFPIEPYSPLYNNDTCADDPCTPGWCLPSGLPSDTDQDRDSFKCLCPRGMESGYQSCQNNSYGALPTDCSDDGAADMYIFGQCAHLYEHHNASGCGSNGSICIDTYSGGVPSQDAMVPDEEPIYHTCICPADALGPFCEYAPVYITCSSWRYDGTPSCLIDWESSVWNISSKMTSMLDIDRMLQEKDETGTLPVYAYGLNKNWWLDERATGGSPPAMIFLDVEHQYSKAPCIFNYSYFLFSLGEDDDPYGLEMFDISVDKGCRAVFKVLLGPLKLYEDGFSELEDVPMLPFPVCFPANATVIMEDGTSRHMTDITPGDIIMTMDPAGNVEYTEMFGFGHIVPHKTSPYLQLLTSMGHKIQLSAEHHIFVTSTNQSHHDAQLVYADEIVIGDNLLVQVGEVIRVEQVVAIEVTINEGIYNPRTKNGNLFVNGILAGTDAAFSPRISGNWLITIIDTIIWMIPDLHIMEGFHVATLLFPPIAYVMWPDAMHFNHYIGQHPTVSAATRDCIQCLTTGGAEGPDFLTRSLLYFFDK